MFKSFSRWNYRLLLHKKHHKFENMSNPSQESIDRLFRSRGAEIYWNHMNQVHHWFHTHMIPEMTKSNMIVKEQMSDTDSSRIHRKKKKRYKENNKKRQRQKKPDFLPESIDETNDESSDSISPEYQEFLEETLKHRSLREREKEEKMMIEEKIEYKLDTEGPVSRPTPSSAPPCVQAGLERTEEMKLLYGSKAQSIQTQETWLQASFDVNLVRYQPKYWPVIPLNL